MGNPVSQNSFPKVGSNTYIKFGSVLLLAIVPQLGVFVNLNPLRGDSTFPPYNISLPTGKLLYFDILFPYLIQFPNASSQYD